MKLAVAASLAASLAVSTLALVWDARRSVDSELISALASASQTARGGHQNVAEVPELLIAAQQVTTDRRR